MFAESSIFEILQSAISLLVQVAHILIAIAAWRFYGLTRRRGYLLVIGGVVISLAVGMFWWAGSMLWTILPSPPAFIMSLYSNTAVMSGLWVLDIAATGTVYLALAWEFLRQLRSTALPVADDAG